MSVVAIVVAVINLRWFSIVHWSKNLQISYLSIKFPISLYNLKTTLLVFVLHRFKHFSLVFILSQFPTNSQTKLKVHLTKSNIRNPITKQQSHTRQQSQMNFRYRSPWYLSNLANKNDGARFENIVFQTAIQVWKEVESFWTWRGSWKFCEGNEWKPNSRITAKTRIIPWVLCVWTAVHWQKGIGSFLPNQTSVTIARFYTF